MITNDLPQTACIITKTVTERNDLNEIVTESEVSGDSFYVFAQKRCKVIRDKAGIEVIVTAEMLCSPDVEINEDDTIKITDFGTYTVLLIEKNGAEMAQKVGLQ